MNRTQAQIVSRIKEVEGGDFFGTQRNDLINELNFANAKEHLVEGVTEEQWAETKKANGTVKEQMIGYMEFAFGKAWGERGLSAGRSLDHFSAWLWLDGNEELSQSILEYDDYGKPQLRQICEYLEIDPMDHGDEDE